MNHIFKTVPNQIEYDNRIEHCAGVEIHLTTFPFTDDEKQFLESNNIKGIHLPVTSGVNVKDLCMLESLIYKSEEFFDFIDYISTLEIEYIVIHFNTSLAGVDSNLLKEHFINMLEQLGDIDVYLENIIPFALGPKPQFFNYSLSLITDFIEDIRNEGFDNVHMLLDLQHHHSYMQLLSLIDVNTELDLADQVLAELELVGKFVKTVHVAGYDGSLSLLDHGISLVKTPKFADTLLEYFNYLPNLENIVYEVYESDYTYCVNAQESRDLLVSKLD